MGVVALTRFPAVVHARISSATPVASSGTNAPVANSPSALPSLLKAPLDSALPSALPSLISFALESALKPALPSSSHPSALKSTFKPIPTAVSSSLLFSLKPALTPTIPSLSTWSATTQKTNEMLSTWTGSTTYSRGVLMKQLARQGGSFSSCGSDGLATSKYKIANNKEVMHRIRTSHKRPLRKKLSRSSIPVYCLYATSSQSSSPSHTM